MREDLFVQGLGPEQGRINVGRVVRDLMVSRTVSFQIAQSSSFSIILCKTEVPPT